MDGKTAATPVVDNSMPTASPVPAAPEPVTAAPATTPTAQPTPQFQPGDRSPELFEALLNLPEGTDPSTLFKSPETAAPAAATQPPTTPAPAPAAPPVTEPQIPDKFKNPDGTPNIAALVKSYTELERSYGEQGNKLGQMSQLQKELEQIKTLITQPQNPAQPAQPAAAPELEAPKFPWEMELTPEEKEALEEERYADPEGYQNKRDQQTMKAMEYRMQQTLEQFQAKLAPVIQERQQQEETRAYATRMAEFAQNNPDFEALKPEMRVISGLISQDALKAMEAAGTDSIQFLYNAAKSLKAPAPAPVPTAEELITKPEYREKILADPNIKNEILKSQIQAVQNGAPPTVISGQPGGVPPAAPAERAGSVKEAGRFAAKFFGL